MFERLLHSEYFFWILVLFFYFLDNVKFVENDKILIVENIFDKFIPKYSFSNFEINEKQVQTLNIFFPCGGFLILDSFPSDEPSANFRETVSELMLFQEEVQPFKIVSLLSFFYLLLGPILTIYFGLGATLLFLMPLHLGTLILTLIFFLSRQKKLGLTCGSVIQLIFNCTVMPAYLPNIVRKIYGTRSFACDGNFFSLETSELSSKELTEYYALRKINFLAERVGNEDFEKYLAYKNKLGLVDERV
jgi:hypothetical protein